MTVITKEENSMKWFKHPTDSNRQPHICALLAEEGHRGVYFYWSIMELICEKMEPKKDTVFIMFDALTKACSTRGPVMANFLTILDQILPNILIKEVELSQTKLNLVGFSLRQVPELMEHFFLDLDRDKEEKENIKRKSLASTPKISKKTEPKIGANIEPSVLTLLPQSHAPNLTPKNKSHPLVEIWNLNCGELAKVQILSSGRLVKVKKLWQTNNQADHWLAIMTKIRESSFCNGENDRGWRANFDWFLRPDTCAKILEGVYDRTYSTGRLSLVQRAVNDWDYQ